jgi:hypothetical protein
MPAIVRVDEDYNVRSIKIDARYFRSYQRTFIVTTGDKTVGAQLVALSIPVAIGVPYSIPGTYFEFDPGSYCTSIEGRQSDDGCKWLVTVNYEPFDPSIYPQNPLMHPIDVNWSFDQYTKIVDEDINGNAVVNTAGDYFDPPVEVDDSRPLLTLVRNEQYYNSQIAGQMKDSINTDAFLSVFPPFTVKCMNIQAQRLYDPYIHWYYKITYEFCINLDLWKREILNQGMRQLSVDGKSNEHIIQKGGPITSPVPLLLNGRAAQPTDDPVFLQFHVLKENAFSVFNFPNLPP